MSLSDRYKRALDEERTRAAATVARSNALQTRGLALGHRIEQELVRPALRAIKKRRASLPQVGWWDVEVRNFLIRIYPNGQWSGRACESSAEFAHDWQWFYRDGVLEFFGSPHFKLDDRQIFNQFEEAVVKLLINYGIEPV